MANCGCKNKSREISHVEKEGGKLININLNTIVKWVLFLLLVVLSPLLIPVIIYVLYKTIIQNKSLDVLTLMTIIGKAIKNTINRSNINLKDMEVLEQ